VQSTYPITHVLITPGVQNSSLDYQIAWYPRLHKLNDLIAFMRRQGFMTSHLIPTFGIFHVHEFQSQRSLLQYMIENVRTSQLEKPKLYERTSETPFIRFTRLMLFTDSATPAMRYLNMLLGLSSILTLPNELRTYFDWNVFIEKLIRRDVLKFSNLSYQYSDCPLPAFMHDYLNGLRMDANHKHDQNIEFFLDLVADVLDNVSSIEIECPIDEQHGEIMNPILDQSIIFSELPLSPSTVDITGVNLRPMSHTMPSVVAHYKEYKSSQFNGLTLTCPKGNSTSMNVMPDIFQIRRLAELRSIMMVEYKRFTSGHALVNMLIHADGGTDLVVDFFQGFLSLVLYPNDVRVTYDEGDLSQMAITYQRNLQAKQPSIINGSTPKLSEIITKMIDVIETTDVFGLSEIGRREHLNISMRKVLILGATGSGDPISRGLVKLFNSHVKQVGALGTGSTVRGLVEAMEFSQGYTTVISDMDFSQIHTEAAFDDFIRSSIMEILNLVQPNILIWKFQYGTTAIMSRTFAILAELNLEYRAYLMRSSFSHLGNFEMYLVMIKPLLDVNAGMNFVPPKGLKQLEILDRGPLRFSEFNVREDEVLAPSILTLDTRQLTSGWFDFAQVLSNMSILMRYMSSVQVARVGYGTDMAYLGRVSRARQMLTYRVNLPYELLPNLPVRLAPSTIGLLKGKRSLATHAQTLGNYIRSATREIMTRDIQAAYANGANKSTTLEDILFIGVGDENARNVGSVFTNSRYAVVDPRVNEALVQFNIDTVKAMFPWTYAEMKANIIQLKQSTQRVVLFFLFMLMNDEPDKATLITRITNIRNLMFHMPEISAIYFNVYLSTPFEDIHSKHVNDKQRNRIGDDLYYTVDANDVFKVTFSERYDPVTTLTTEEVEKIFTLTGHDDLALIKLSLKDQDVYRLRQRDGVIPTQTAVPFLEFGYSACPLFVLKRDITA